MTTLKELDEFLAQTMRNLEIADQKATEKVIGVSGSLSLQEKINACMDSYNNPMTFLIAMLMESQERSVDGLSAMVSLSSIAKLYYLRTQLEKAEKAGAN